jgi:hypothetical protein
VFVRERTVFGSPGFIVDGSFRRMVRGFVEVPDATGRVHRLRIRGFPLDPYPRVEVDGVVLDVFPRLPGWATALCTIPAVLVLTGGVVGGVIGVFAVYGNFRVARTGLPGIARFALGALLTVSACALAFAVAFAIRSATR